MGGEAQLQAELKRIEGAKKTREASEELAKFVRANEAMDPLVHKQPENPYVRGPVNGGPPCAECVIS